MKTFLKFDLTLQILLILGCVIGTFFPEIAMVIDKDLGETCFILGIFWMFISGLIAEDHSPKNPRLKIFVLLFLGTLISFLSLFVLGPFGLILIAFMGVALIIAVLLNLILTYQSIRGKELMKLPNWYNKVLDSDEILKIDL